MQKCLKVYGYKEDTLLDIYTRLYLNVTMIYILNLLVMCQLAIPYIAEEVDQLVVDEPGLVEVVEPGHH